VEQNSTYIQACGLIRKLSALGDDAKVKLGEAGACGCLVSMMAVYGSNNLDIALKVIKKEAKRECVLKYPS
jgi:hypothetical protein